MFFGDDKNLSTVGQKKGSFIAHQSRRNRGVPENWLFFRPAWIAENYERVNGKKKVWSFIFHEAYSFTKRGSGSSELSLHSSFMSNLSFFKFQSRFLTKKSTLRINQRFVHDQPILYLKKIHFNNARCHWSRRVNERGKVSVNFSHRRKVKDRPRYPGRPKL